MSMRDDRTSAERWEDFLGPMFGQVGIQQRDPFRHVKGSGGTMPVYDPGVGSTNPPPGTGGVPGVPGASGVPGGGGTSLPPGTGGGQGSAIPDWIKNNPDAYYKLLGYRNYDPLEMANIFGGGLQRRQIGGSNGLIVLNKQDNKKAAIAAALGAYANNRQLESLRAATQGRAMNPTLLGKAVGGIGDAMGGQHTGAPSSGSYQGWGGVTGGGVNPSIPTADPGFWGSVGGALKGLGGYL